jgi:hypothetical protein
MICRLDKRGCRRVGVHDPLADENKWSLGAPPGVQIVLEQDLVPGCFID